MVEQPRAGRDHRGHEQDVEGTALPFAIDDGELGAVGRPVDAAPVREGHAKRGTHASFRTAQRGHDEIAGALGGVAQERDEPSVGRPGRRVVLARARRQTQRRARVEELRVETESLAGAAVPAERDLVALRRERGLAEKARQRREWHQPRGRTAGTAEHARAETIPRGRPQRARSPPRTAVKPRRDAPRRTGVVALDHACVPVAGVVRSRERRRRSARRSAALWYRRSGSFSRQRSISSASLGGASGFCVSTGSGGRFSTASWTMPSVRPVKAGRPVTSS